MVRNKKVNWLIDLLIYFYKRTPNQTMKVAAECTDTLLFYVGLLPRIMKLFSTALIIIENKEKVLCIRSVRFSKCIVFFEVQKKF